MTRRVLASFALATAGALGLSAVVAPPGRSALADEQRAAAPVVDPATALEGGTALPEGAWKITFPWIVKQSVSFVSEAAVERMVGAVNFSDPGTKPLGTVSLDGKGGGSGAFAVTVADISTLSPERDEYLRSDAWLDAKRFPEITYAITKLEKLRPTVYRVTGTWKMHGVEKEVSALANVRFVEKMEPLPAPNGLARLKTKLTLSLKAFGVANPDIGSPAVADAWDVEMVLLGVLEKP